MQDRTRTDELPADQRVNILLVDDQPANLLALRAVLEDLGHNLVDAGSGAEAVERLRHEDFAVVLLDVQMHGLDGFETAKLIRSQERSRHTPVIFLTAYDTDRATLEQAYALGAVDYLVKPLVPVILRAKIAVFVELFQKTEQVRRQAERVRAADREEFDQTVREQREWFRVALASIGDAVITTDTQGRVTFLNPVAEALTGWTQPEAQGQPLEQVFRIIHEETRQPVEHPVATVIREGSVVGLGNHTALMARDGTERAIADSAAPIHDGRGRTLGVVMVFRDVTDERRAERAVRESEARKAAILQTALDCIITIDHEGRIVEFNPAAERTFGCRRDAAVGRDIAEVIIPPSLRERHHEGLARYLATGEGPVLGRRIEMPALRADGTEFPVELAITRIPAEGPPLFTAYLRDISERRGQERRRNARLAVTQVLAEAGGVEEAATRILEAVCTSLAWDVGILWTVDRHGPVLRCTEVWHTPSPRMEEFEVALCRLAFTPGVGLPGRVWSSRRPAWITDVVQDANFPRAAAAAQAGLHGAFAFPVLLGSEFLGVIEFFSSQTREPDADLLEMMATIGGQVGQFIERKGAEERLRRSERELADFFENAAMGLHWVGPDGTILRVNQAELDLLGYSREEYVGRNIAEFHADEQTVCDILRRLQAGETLRAYESRLRCKDGSTKYVHISSNVLREGDQFIHTRCFTLDVTDRRLAEERLRESEQRFARFMQHLPGLAWIKDVDGRYIYVNEAAERAFRTPREKLYGKTDEEVFPPETAARFRENDRKALASGLGVRVIETLEHEDGVLHHSLVSKFPIPGPDGTPALVGGTAIDITDRIRAEEALKEADRQKNEFLAMLAHELRNPLAPVRNALHILKMPGADRSTQEQARSMMERQIQHMVRLVDDLLDVSRIIGGRIQLHREPVDLVTVVGRAVETAQPAIDAHGHELIVSLPPGRVVVDADLVRLSQVITNLLTNAAKYTERAGRIWLSAESDGGEVVVRVRDCGVGIAPELLPRIFDLFVQADRSLARSEGGLGVGLSLVKRLVEMHGGSVSASSPGPGQGSEFVVRLPVLPEAPVDRLDAQEGEGGTGPKPRPRKVLVVDDNVDAAESAAMLLRLWGHEVQTVHDGLSVLQAVRDFGPEIILLDIGLPGMTGYEVAQQLRSQPEFGALVLAAMTGYGQDEDKRRSREAGFDHHLTKPLDPEKLEALVASSPSN